MSPHHEEEHEMVSQGQGYLAKLSDLDYELEDDSPDVMGWDVADRFDNTFGRVDDLLVDMSSGQILFGIISYEEQGERQSTLVPLAGTQINTDKKQLSLPMEDSAVKAAPVFKDDTEDVRPFFDYWMNKIEQWAEAAEEEEVESEDIARG